MRRKKTKWNRRLWHSLAGLAAFTALFSFADEGWRVRKSGFALSGTQSTPSASLPKPDPALYLGQTPPGDRPEVFAPGLVSLPERSDLKIVFSPDGRDGLIGVRGNGVPTILSIKNDNGRWTKPETAGFMVANQQEKEPFFSPDGNKSTGRHRGSLCAGRPVVGKQA